MAAVEHAADYYKKPPKYHKVLSNSAENGNIVADELPIRQQN
jgi:hypothetical protein